MVSSGSSHCPLQHTAHRLKLCVSVSVGRIASYGWGKRWPGSLHRDGTRRLQRKRKSKSPFVFTFQKIEVAVKPRPLCGNSTRNLISHAVWRANTRRAANNGPMADVIHCRRILMTALSGTTGITFRAAISAFAILLFVGHAAAQSKTTVGSTSKGKSIRAASRKLVWRRNN
jgi:hypothetical protein